MDILLSILAPIVLVAFGYTVGTTKVVQEGNEALVERFGKYRKKLDPGLNYNVVPFIDKIAVEESTREQILDIEPQQAITKDNVQVEVDAIVYWKILDMYKAFYAVDNVHEAIENLVMTTLRSTIGQMELDETYASRDRINQNLLQQLDDASADWGVKVMRVEVQEIKPPQTIIDALEKERAAKSEKQAKILQAEGTVESIQMISKALEEESNTQKVLQFLIAQRYVEANEKLSESSNSKVVFMDPKALSEAMTDLLQTESPGQSN